MSPRVPDALADLGAVFTSAEPGEKVARRARDDGDLFGADVANAYLDAGHNYAVTTRNDLAVLDADAPDALADVLDALPATPWQVSGSGEGEHHFLRVPGLDSDVPLSHPETGENVGHVKAAPKSYVVAPGSRHPSGNRYGPLHDADLDLATVERETLADLLDAFLSDSARDRLLGREPVHTPTHAGGSDGAGGWRDDAHNDDRDLSVYDVLRACAHPEGERVAHPVHGSDTGANFQVDAGGETWRCWRHDCTGNALHLVGMKHGLLSCGEWVHGRVDAETWGEIFDAARDDGLDVPDPDPQADGGAPMVVLPDVDAPTDTPVWDWRSATRRLDPDDDSLTLDTARDRTKDALADAMRRGDRVLIPALPSMGKSHGSVLAAAETETPTTVLTSRGHREQYQQYREWADDAGLTPYVLPSAHRDCPTFRGDHGDGWKERVRALHDRGATPREIHARAERWFGQSCPCNDDGECPYSAKWRFDADEYDLLIGHYGHAHVPSVTQGRAVVVDEFPGDAYETALAGERLAGAVSRYLAETPAVPFTDYTDLIEHRDDDGRRAEALAHFGGGAETDGGLAVHDDGHAAAPLAVYALLASDDLGNGWEHATLPAGSGGEGGDAAIARGDDALGVFIHRTPPLDHASAVVALDGTPTPWMWRRTLGLRGLNERAVLTDDERAEYVRDVLGLSIVQTTEHIKPYSSGDHVSLRDDAALLDAIRDHHGRVPDGLITTRSAHRAYRTADDDVFPDDLLPDYLRDPDPDGGGRWYGDLKGSNRHEDSRFGAVVGSRHYGDGYIKKWCALRGDAATDPDRESGPTHRGGALSYGDMGDDVLRHMRDHETLQAALRFGRDGGGALVYVHTGALPEWVPVEAEGRVVRTRSDGERDVLTACRALARTAPGGEWTSRDVADHPAVDVGTRQVRTHLGRLADRGVLARRDGGRGYRYDDGGLHRVNDHGDVTLPDVDAPTTDAAATDAPPDSEVARSGYYTWDFRVTPGTSGGDAAATAADAQTEVSQPADAPAGDSKPD